MILSESDMAGKPTTTDNNDKQKYCLSSDLFSQKLHDAKDDVR